jgi:hypothetical protein
VCWHARDVLLPKASVSANAEPAPGEDYGQLPAADVVITPVWPRRTSVSWACAPMTAGRPERARDPRRHWLPLAEAKQARPRPAFRAVCRSSATGGTRGALAESRADLCADLRVQTLRLRIGEGTRLAARPISPAMAGEGRGWQSPCVSDVVKKCCTVSSGGALWLARLRMRAPSRVASCLARGIPLRLSSPASFGKSEAFVVPPGARLSV